MNFNKLFSFGYPSFTEDPDLFYNCLKNSSEKYRNELFDIYFSVPYKYTFNGQEFAYGDVMGAPISDAHVQSLMRIQKEFGIELSLTFNETYPNKELVDDLSVFDGFIKHIGKYYDMGIRSCTISHVHMMATGVLQRNFPEMRWKNTVNHIITNPQQVVDYHLLGYDVINLDRSLNRDMDMLRKIQPVRKKYPNLILSLLVTEGCMPHCPFKVEHDTMNKTPDWNYWKHHGNLTCKIWRHNETNDLPRIGTDMVWGDKKTFLEYAELVDYFKFSGRMGQLPAGDTNQKFIWSNISHIKGSRWTADNWDLNKVIESGTKYATADCFEDIINNSDGVVSNFQHGRFVNKDHVCDISQYKDIDKETAWGTGKGRALNHVLKNCKNECWDCHACERTFGIPDFDSLIQLNRDASVLRGHAEHFKGIPIVQQL